MYVYVYSYICILMAHNRFHIINNNEEKHDEKNGEGGMEWKGITIHEFHV